jgi:hypothetical protein
MSTIIYNKGVLASDSGFINKIGYGRQNCYYSSSNNVKMAVSEGGYVALGIVGNVLNVPLKEIATVIEDHLKEHRSLSVHNNELQEYLFQICKSNLTELSFIVMESFNRKIYNIDLVAGDNNSKHMDLSIMMFNEDDIFGLGTGSIHALIACKAGCNAIDAVKFAIKHDNASKGPIHYINLDDLSIEEKTNG